jgi:hypothetical protein
MMIGIGITSDDIETLTGGRIGVFDRPCPICSPYRKPVNRKKRVMRIWRDELGFATYHCAHCAIDGFVRDGSLSRPLDRATLVQIRFEAAERERIARQNQIAMARWLWSSRLPVAGTAAEVYLREVRGYRGALPATLGFLPARAHYLPAMIAAFGIANEPEPGILVIPEDAMRAVHLTRLKADGTGKAGTDRDKIMVGRPTGSPIVLAPINDNLGLAITEGIEEGLSLYAATGLGVWAAGSASHLRALADVVPSFVECATVIADADEVGQRGANDLANELSARGIESEIGTVKDEGRAAA